MDCKLGGVVGRSLIVAIRKRSKTAAMLTTANAEATIMAALPLEFASEIPISAAESLS